MTVWRKAETPKRLHYSHNRRICPILGLSSEGWVAEASESMVNYYNSSLDDGNTRNAVYGLDVDIISDIRFQGK